MQNRNMSNGHGLSIGNSPGPYSPDMFGVPLNGIPDVWDGTRLSQWCLAL